MVERVVVVGAGQAAGQTVVSLRQRGYGGAITLIGDEPHPPYQRPPLSKKFLAGELPPERLYLKPAGFYADQGIDLRHSTSAESIDRQAAQVRLASGEGIEYDRLVLALGSKVRHLSCPGYSLPGIHSLRTIRDVEAIRERFQAGRRLVIVGGGYIGMEVAAIAVQTGLAVTVLEMADRLMSRVVAPEVSAFFEATHRQMGVDIRLATTVTGFAGGPAVGEVHCGDGETIAADLVIVGAGVVPETALAEAAGLPCGDGIMVDEFCRTSDHAVLAVGDCTSQPSALYARRVHLESVDNAMQQARTAAATLCGDLEAGRRVPWFWSEQYDLKLQIAGLSAGHDRVVLRGDPAARQFAVFYLRDGRLIACEAVSSPAEFMQSKKLIEQQVPADPALLADTARPFKDIAAELAPGP